MRLALVAMLCAAALVACGDAGPAPRARDDTTGTAAAGAAQPRAFAPAAAPARPTRPRGRWTTARVRRATLLRARPAGRALARIGTRTEFGSPRVLAVVAARRGWLRVLASELANGRTGWVATRDVALGATNWLLVVDRSARRLELRHGARVVRRLPVAVGRPGTPTPLGRFAVTDKLRPQEPDSPYGCCALALSGHQTRLVAGWPGGDRLAVHGTPQPWTVGRAVSLGCMRAHRRDLSVLMRRVPLGAPVFVRP